MSSSRPGYPVLVLGSDRAPPDLVTAKLNEIVAPKCGEWLVVLVLSEDEQAAGAWGETCDYCSIQFEPVAESLFGRRLAPVRWAMRVASIAAEVVLFGDDRPHWRVLRYLSDAAVPIWRVKIPRAYTPAIPAPAPVAVVAEARASWRAVPERDPWAVMSGAGPGGYPD